MHDSAIKNFCVWARRELMSEVERRCALYDISDHPENPKDAQAVGGRVLSSQERKQRSDLLQKAHDEGYDTLVEQAAYTWFNRIMAIRFMEINDRLPSHTRLLSGNDGSFKPQALAEALQVDIEGIDRAHVAQLVQSGDDEETFRYLFLAQCAELASCMPTVFSQVGSSVELLLPDGLLRQGGVIERMVEDIPDEDWLEGVEIVGWMYQYYVSERKDEYFASKRKATREDLAPATQLFTPEWIVRYLTENSLGRLWMLNHPDSALATRMEYYIAPDVDAETDFKRIESPEDITVVDPACGSGHILVYAFDLIAAMYEEEGYSRRDIPRLILEKNLTGLEIDPRAAAMASFALTMKACEYDSRFLRRGVHPRITVLSRVEFSEEERDAIARTMKDQERLDAPFLLEQADLLDVLAHLDEAGSLFAPTEADLGSVRAVAETVMDEAGMFGMAAAEKAQRALEELGPLARHYDVVAANPPYLSNMNDWLKSWVKKNYPDGKNDLFAAFIYRNLRFANASGQLGFMTPYVWMFISSYEKMRSYLIDRQTIISLVQLEYSGFSGATVPICIFTLQKGASSNYQGGYVRLSDFKGAANQAPKTLEAIQNPDCGWFYRVDQQDFKKIPGLRFGYWASSSQLVSFDSAPTLGKMANLKVGLQTGNNSLFLRLWWEISRNLLKTDACSRAEACFSKCKWFPYNKGGQFRKWYGNLDYIINWENDGEQVRDYPGSVIRNPEYYFQESITWTDITSSGTHFRLRPHGSLYDVKGMSLFAPDTLGLYLLAMCNSTALFSFLKIMSPTLSTQAGEVSQLPAVLEDSRRAIIEELSGSNTSVSKTDWDSLETSWDFAELPLVRLRKPGDTLEQSYESWKANCNDRFYQLKANEEELNRIFAEIYHMEDEVPIEVPLDKVSVHIVFDSDDDVPEELKGSNYVRTKADEVKSLISYAVGCIMGRYSLDKPGLVLANQGDGLSEYLQQVPDPSFAPDADGIIPLTDIEYFHDDATGLFVDFMAAAFGEEHLEENLRFVADALGGTGTPRQVIRAYFRDGFFADHCKTYSVQSAGKRPIYWLFDSGKKGGFRALFYMHRYTPDLLARLRTEYVLPQQDRYRTQIDVIDGAMTTADRREAADLRKRRKKLADQLAETVAYEEKVHHLSDQMIEIDLDDGVKHNYALFQDVLAKIK